MRYSIQNSTIEKVKAVGASDIKETRAVGIIFAELTTEQVAQLKVQGATLSVVVGVKAGVLPIVISPPIPIISAIPTYTPEELIWAARLEEMRTIFDPPLFGEGIVVAIIGTGIRSTHQRLQGRVVYEKNYTTSPMRDGLGHDTCVADIIITITPLCSVLNLKVLDDKGEGTEEAVILALDDCISFHDTNPSIAPAVINLSLGAPDDGNPNNPLRVACRAVIKKGIFIFASAGNSGPTPFSITCPATERYVFAVGAAKYLPEESSFIVSNFSSRGPTLEGLIKPDAILFGENIQLASNESDTATIAKSGTSFAAPFGAALVIMYLDGAKRQAIMKQMVWMTWKVRPEVPLFYVPPEGVLDDYLSIISVKPAGVPPGKDNTYGYGFPYAPYLYNMITARPMAADITTTLQQFLPLIGLALMGMVIPPLMKEKKK